MIAIEDATEIAQSAQHSVTGCALLDPLDTIPPEWHTVIISTGDLIRVDTVDGKRPDVAIAALKNADFSPSGCAKRAKQRAAMTALNSLLTSTDPALRGIVALFRLAFTKLNDEAQRHGQPRILEPEIIQQAIAVLIAE